MLASREREQLKAAGLAALTTGFFCVEWRLARSLAGPIPWAVAFDLLISFPALYTWLVLRPAARPWSELAPALIVGLAWAKLALARSPQLHGPLVVWACALELALIGQFVWRCARLFRAETDLLLHVQALRDPLLRAVGLELCVLYYAFVAPLGRPALTAERAFDTGQSARQLLAALGLVSVLEAVGVHIVLRAYWPVAAWIALALSAYGLLWIIGAHRASRLRPLLVQRERVLVRVSLLFSADLERSAIARVEPYAAQGGEGIARLTFASRPNLLLSMTQPVATYGLFGRVRHADRIALHVEDPQGLMQLLCPAADSGGSPTPNRSRR